MSAIDAGAVPVARKRFFRPATVLVALVSVTIMLLAARYVIEVGYVRKDILALEAGDAWKTGGWLSQVVLRVVSLIDDRWLRQTTLSLISAVAAGLTFGVLYERMRAHGWLAIGAVLVLLALGLHAATLYTITAQSRAIPLYIAVAALIPAIRSMEEVGDVQAAIGLGLMLPLLLLASPTTTPLILPLAVGVALANPDARRDPRAFAAMLLVAMLPTLIVAIGILGFLAQAGFDVADALMTYVNTYRGFHFGDPMPSLVALAAFAPVGLVPLVYCVYPGLPEKRHVVSALLILAFPLYLVLVRTTLVTAMTPIVPPLALIAGFVSWLAVVRLPMALRVFAVAMLVVSAAASWLLPSIWSDPDWLAALGHLLPAGNLELRPGV
jgi:hypothetical protein